MSGRDKNLSEVAYRRIEKLIQDGTYKAGDPLPELELCSTLGMSRTPIREALFRLQEDMLVVIKPHFGAFVASLDLKQVQNLYDLREVIEGLIAILDCRQSVDVQPFVSLRSRYEAFVSSQEKDLEALDKLNEEFNVVFLKQCQNDMAIKVFNSIRSKVTILHSVGHLIPYFPIQSIGERLDVLEPIIAKDSTKAEQAARQRVRNCYQRILDWMSKQR